MIKALILFLLISLGLYFYFNEDEEKMAVKEIFPVNLADKYNFQTKKINGVIGARMMGGGFGGCTVNLVESNKIPDIVSKIKKNYKSDYGINLKAIIAKPGSGIKVVKN